MPHTFGAIYSLAATLGYAASRIFEFLVSFLGAVGTLSRNLLGKLFILAKYLASIPIFVADFLQTGFPSAVKATYHAITEGNYYYHFP